MQLLLSSLGDKKGRMVALGINDKECRAQFKSPTFPIATLIISAKSNEIGEIDVIIYLGNV